MGGRFRFLDDISLERKGMMVPFDHPDAAPKTKSHILRLRGNFSSDFQEDSRNDFLLARFIFASQMFVSGTYRHRIFATASDQQDYFYQRFRNPGKGTSESGAEIIKNNRGEVLGGEGNMGLEMEEFVHARLAQTVDEKPDTVRSIIRKTKQNLDVHEGLLKQKHELLAASGVIVNGILTSPHFGDPESPVAVIALTEQELWTAHLIDQISFAAHSRRSLDKVPLLQPVSITGQPMDDTKGVNYPFASLK